MLIQSLVLIAAMVVLGGAILTSTLVSAKASLHQALMAKTQTAMSDATAAFVAVAAGDVHAYGTEQAWPAAAPWSEALCGGAAADGSAPASAACPLLATIVWTVTGRTSAAPVPAAPPGASPAGVPGQRLSDAQNLAATLDEQRVSATISVRITKADGRTLLADRSREVTARIFNAKPYVVITASRDVASAAGSIGAAEGDTGGAAAPPAPAQQRPPSPDPQKPAAFTDTLLHTSIDCLNSSNAFDQADPTNPVDAARFVDGSVRPFGNQDWAYEAPCTPRYDIDTSQAPPGYEAPAGNVYSAKPPASDRVWQKGDENTSSFAR